MITKRSAASKRMWAKIPVATRIETMRNLAKLKNEKMTKEQRKLHSVKMFKAKLSKHGHN